MNKISEYYKKLVTSTHNNPQDTFLLKEKVSLISSPGTSVTVGTANLGAQSIGGACTLKRKKTNIYKN